MYYQVINHDKPEENLLSEDHWFRLVLLSNPKIAHFPRKFRLIQITQFPNRYINMGFWADGK